MLEIPVHNIDGKQVDSLQVDEQSLGSYLRHDLLKQAYVRFHANLRQGSAHGRSRSDVSGSTRKLYKQKGTGNARRGAIGSNITRGGGQAFAKRAHSWRQTMPRKMRQLANRNALLAKAVDGEIKVIDGLKFDKPSTRQFTQLLTELKIDRTCLVALTDTSSSVAKSAGNVSHVDVTRVDHLNAFALLNHRYLVVDKEALLGWISRGQDKEAS